MSSFLNPKTKTIKKNSVVVYFFQLKFRTEKKIPANCKAFHELLNPN
jgi:hypothetical protein